MTLINRLKSITRSIKGTAIALSVSLLFFSLTACSNQMQEDEKVAEPIIEAPQDTFANNGISEYLQQIYADSSRRFSEFFTPEEYVKLCSVADSISAEPSYAISKYVFSVHQDISTYNVSEHNYLVIDTSGNTVIDYGQNDSVDFTINNVAFGSLTFFYTGSRTYDILDEQGRILNSVQYSKDPVYIADLGSGFYLFATISNIGRSSYDLYILNPDGKCYQVINPTGYWKARIDIDMSEIPAKYSIDAQIGNVSEGMVSVCYTRSVRGSDETCAYYCDTSGNLVINLSSNEMKFHVTELEDFSNGLAQIEFVGADRKKYQATINQSGQFVDEPELIS